METIEIRSITSCQYVTQKQQHFVFDLITSGKKIVQTADTRSVNYHYNPQFRMLFTQRIAMLGTNQRFLNLRVIIRSNVTISRNQFRNWPFL